MKQYGKAVELLKSSDRELKGDDAAAAKELKKSCWLNLAAAQIKGGGAGPLKEAVKNCSAVLDVDPSNVKALFRRAQAHMGCQDYVEAEMDVKRGLAAEPDNKDLDGLYKRLKVAMKEQNRKESKMYGKMFAPAPVKKPVVVAEAAEAVAAPEPGAAA